MAPSTRTFSAICCRLIKIERFDNLNRKYVTFKGCGDYRAFLGLGYKYLIGWAGMDHFSTRLTFEVLKNIWDDVKPVWFTGASACCYERHCERGCKVTIDRWEQGFRKDQMLTWTKNRFDGLMMKINIRGKEVSPLDSSSLLQNQYTGLINNLTRTLLSSLLPLRILLTRPRATEHGFARNKFH